MSTQSAMTANLEAIRERATSFGPDSVMYGPDDREALLAMVDHLMAKHAEVQALSMRRGEEISRLHGELSAKA
ncbi:hypothetical protein [Nocardiopsis eucommiae]|uniref:hypothetical protein n=1 Tax=Nocardiopsis eucommiae TaxID=2831970 RepID=UPI003D70CCB5